MTRERILFLVAGIVETLLAIPLLALTLIISTSAQIWAFAIVLHIVALVLAIKVNEKRAGSIVGIVANIPPLSLIPLVANILHATAAVLNFYQAFRDQDPTKAIAETAKKASDAAEKAVDTVVDTAKGASKKTADVAEDVADATVDTAKSAGGAVADAAETVVDKADDAIDATAETVKKADDAVVDANSDDEKKA